MKLQIVLLCCSVLWLSAETKEIRKNIPVKNARIAALRGFDASSIEIKTWEKNEVSVRLSVDFSMSDKQQEKELIQGIDVVTEQIGDTIVLRFRGYSTPGGMSAVVDFFKSLFSTSYSNLTVKGEIYLPAAFHLVSDMRYGVYSVDGVNGEVRLSGIANTLTVTNSPAVRIIENNFGSTSVERSGGALMLTGESSKISVNNFRGSVTAAVNFSFVTMEGISNDATVVCHNGNVSIGGIGGALSMDVDFSTVAADHIKGAVTVKSQSGTIRVKNAGGAVVKAPYSNITVEDIVGSGNPVVIHNSAGHVTITGITRDITVEDTHSQLIFSGIRGNIGVTGSGSTVRGSKITGNIFISNEYGTIRMDELSATTVDVRNKYNSVEIHLLVKPSVITITNEHAPVSLSLPEFSGEIRIDASYGSIKTNLPLQVNTTPAGATAEGKIGTGSGTISISNVSERIDLNVKNDTKKQ